MSRRRTSENQTNFFESPGQVADLRGLPSNDDEEQAPKVRITEFNEEYVNILEEDSKARPFSVSLFREHGKAKFCLTFTYEQMKQVVIQASKLLGTVAVDLDDLDDNFPETEEDEDEE